MPMIPLLSRAQMRKYDAHAIEVAKVPGIILMENAGRGAAELIARHNPKAKVAVLCGRGNNGGDGFVVCRHLLAAGIAAEALLVAPRAEIGGDARLQLEALVGIGGTVHCLGEASSVDADTSASDTNEVSDALAQHLAGADVIVDAIFGTGLKRPVSGRYLTAIEHFNRSAGFKVALDLPSGIDADTGAILGQAVIADMTMTFGQRKAGLYQGAGGELSGTVVVVGLGIPDGALLSRIGHLAALIEPIQLSPQSPAQRASAHKYQRGAVLVVAGSTGKIGAALLSAEAALRSGAGMATIASWPDAVRSIQGRVREVMTTALDPAALDASLGSALARCKAVALGPGLGLDEKARRVSEKIALHWQGPVVVDADAIGHFAGRAELLQQAAGPRILTPHAGELGRLLGCTSREIEAHRFEAAKTAAAKTKATVVLKGPHTIVATGDTLSVCEVRSGLLATAGSGDVLSGLLAALLCHNQPHDAACAGVWLHAHCAQLWQESRCAAQGMLAGDIASLLPQAFAALTTL